MNLTIAEIGNPAVLPDLGQSLALLQAGMDNVVISSEQVVREREATRRVVLERIEALVAANAQTAAQNGAFETELEGLNSRAAQMKDTHAALRSSETALEATLQGQVEQKETAVLQLERELEELEREAARLGKLIADERLVNMPNSDRTLERVINMALGVRPAVNPFAPTPFGNPFFRKM